MQPPSPLPVEAVLPEVLSRLTRHSNIVLKAPTGAGKSTRVPPALLAAGFAQEGLIVVLEPRRLAAQTSARRMAAEHRESVGQTFGYQIRFDRKATPATRVVVVTEGIFLRMLLDDPLLEKVAVVVFDEFHERSLNSDLALALTRRLQAEFRPELKLVVMSATFDPVMIAEFLRCPVVTSEGRLFPVDIRHVPQRSDRPMHVQAAAGILAMVAETRGDVLAFLPGVGEIRRTRAELIGVGGRPSFDLFELYGDLPAEQQEAALRPAPRRKVILATNVAETSVTVPGVTAVVDTGYARIVRCDPTVGLNRLELTRISRASANQRAGRAGRTGPGVCLRLWPAEEGRLLKEQETPEIERLELSGAVLQLHAWGESDPFSFPWFQAPPVVALERAEHLLEKLGALHQAGITDLGCRLARLPVHPRLARLLIEGQRLGCVERTATAAAFLSERDPFQRDASHRQGNHVSSSDLLDRVQALEAFAQSDRCDSPVGTLIVPAAKQLLRVRDQLLRELRDGRNDHRPSASARGSADERLLQALVAAFPDRVARLRDPGSRRGVMVGGRGVRLAEGSAVHDGDLLLCVDVEEIGGTEALVRQASRVERDWLPRELLQTKVEVQFDSDRERVVAFQRLRYEDLLLEEAATATPDPDQVAEILAQAAAEQLERVVPRSDDAFAQFLARVRCLRTWMPELELPSIGDEELRSLLPAIARQRRSFAELRHAPWLDFLQRLLSPQQLAAVHREAPEQIAAASGSRVRLQYEAGRPPVMPVRIQEMFGQLATPCVAGGRVKVLLHLLGPNHRPQQVTDDLRGFWERGYPSVRKELRRRYPKHFWPEDPVHAEPERRPRKKT